jgi:hypothetical protein
MCVGAKLGNPFAKNIAVGENPYAKMCNQIMMEVMGREMNRAPACSSDEK